jgi:hypothetical protein
MKRTLLVLAILSLAVAAGAQTRPPILYTPQACWRGGEMPVLPLSVQIDGNLRAFFRHVGAADWCSVEGENRGPISSVTMPKFTSGDEIEYFFVVAEGKRVLARSPQIYRVKVTDGCETPWARHTIMVIVNCSPVGSGQIGSAMASGFTIGDEVVTGNTPFGSPDRPTPPVGNNQ